jgi:hypothetical protein
VLHCPFRKKPSNVPRNAFVATPQERRCDNYFATQLEKPELVLVVGDQHVFGLPVVTEHHLMSLSPESGLLVATEGCMGRIGVIYNTSTPTLICLSS